MYTISLTPEMQASALVLGCMRLTELSGSELDLHLKTALELGINFFDHADIYGGYGGCERHFGEWLRANPHLRSQMLIQSKCGIVQNEEDQNVSFDFSYGHILKSVDNSLRYLGIEQLDVLLLHRPDALFEPQEVAAAFDELYASGKVRAFGVSNMHSGQIELLRCRAIMVQPSVWSGSTSSPPYGEHEIICPTSPSITAESLSGPVAFQYG